MVITPAQVVKTVSVHYTTHDLWLKVVMWKGFLSSQLVITSGTELLTSQDMASFCCWQRGWFTKSMITIFTGTLEHSISIAFPVVFDQIANKQG